MGISDALHARRQDADRQQSPGARYQNLCHWQKELAVQRHRRGSQGQCRRLQSDADLPRLTRRAVSLVAPRPHRIASARGRRRYYRPAALQLPQNRRCLNGSDAALDTKAIRQKRGRHRAEKIALTKRWFSPRKATMPWLELVRCRSVGREASVKGHPARCPIINIEAELADSIVEGTGYSYQQYCEPRLRFDLSHSLLMSHRFENSVLTSARNQSSAGEFARSRFVVWRPLT